MPLGFRATTLDVFGSILPRTQFRPLYLSTLTPEDLKSLREVEIVYVENMKLTMVSVLSFLSEGSALAVRAVGSLHVLFALIIFSRELFFPFPVLALTGEGINAVVIKLGKRLSRRGLSPAPSARLPVRVSCREFSQ